MMSFKLSPPVIETFTLEETDKNFGTKGTTVTIRQASTYQHEKRQSIFADMKSRFTDDGSVYELVQTLNTPELHRIEAQLTMTDCNILDEDEKPLFTFKQDKKGHAFLDMTNAEFEAAWGLLPMDITEEISGKVREVNLKWKGPVGE
jgi:hypothetical protein